MVLRASHCLLEAVLPENKKINKWIKLYCSATKEIDFKQNEAI